MARLLEDNKMHSLISTRLLTEDDFNRWVVLSDEMMEKVEVISSD